MPALPVSTSTAGDSSPTHRAVSSGPDSILTYLIFGCASARLRILDRHRKRRAIRDRRKIGSKSALVAVRGDRRRYDHPVGSRRLDVFDEIPGCVKGFGANTDQHRHAPVDFLDNHGAQLFAFVRRQLVDLSGQPEADDPVGTAGEDETYRVALRVKIKRAVPAECRAQRGKNAAKRLLLLLH